jgi:hypothetical protein
LDFMRFRTVYSIAPALGSHSATQPHRLSSAARPLGPRLSGHATVTGCDRLCLESSPISLFLVFGAVSQLVNRIGSPMQQHRPQGWKSSLHDAHISNSANRGSHHSEQKLRAHVYSVYVTCILSLLIHSYKRTKSPRAPPYHYPRGSVIYPNALLLASSVDASLARLTLGTALAAAVITR